MLISHLSLRLEIAKDISELKYLRPYVAKVLEARQAVTSVSNIKSYASVARGATSQREIKVSRSSSLKEVGRGEKYQKYRDRIPSLGEAQSHSFQQATDIPRERSIVGADPTGENLLEPDARQKEVLASIACRGQRVFKDIHIELIDEQTFIQLLMASSSEKQMPTGQDEEPSTSQAGYHSSMRDEQHAGESGDQKPHEAHSNPDGRPSASQGISANHSATVRLKSHSPTLKVPTTINFYSGNPCVELTKGLLHIYKDSQMTTLEKDVARSEMLCMLGVPASYTVHDLIKFIAPMGDCVSYMQVLRDAFPNQYMLLIKFRDQTSADDFYSYFNNRPFNSIEPDICHLVYVAKVEVVNESEGGSLPLFGMTELPNCPVCLERMEESVDGILTVLCNHAFHTHCLAQWEDTSCPVCRYCQTPEEVADQKCMQCGSHESLWICLICGNVGCGRYVGLHAYKHFKDTKHTFTMQLSTKRVWDYARHDFVYQKKADGKLVVVDEGGNEVWNEKLDSITLELKTRIETVEEDLLEHQIHSQTLSDNPQDWQREVTILQLQLKHVTDEKSQLKTRIETVEEDLLEHQIHSQTLSDNLQDCQREVTILQLQLKHVTDEKSQLKTRIKNVKKELHDEEELNKSLTENQQDWHLKVCNLEIQLKKMTDKKDQLHAFATRALRCLQEEQKKVAGLEGQVKDLGNQLEDTAAFWEEEMKGRKQAESKQSEIFTEMQNMEKKYIQELTELKKKLAKEEIDE